jgi:hypothetical protein
MKHKSIAVASITILLCMFLGNIIACVPTTEYALFINSTEGGSVNTPGEDTFTYYAATVVEFEYSCSSSCTFQASVQFLR